MIIEIVDEHNRVHGLDIIIEKKNIDMEERRRMIFDDYIKMKKGQKGDEYI